MTPTTHRTSHPGNGPRDLPTSREHEPRSPPLRQNTCHIDFHLPICRSMRLTGSIVGSLVFAVLSAQFANAEDRPDASVETKTMSASISIDKDLKAYPGLYDNLLAEGRKELAKWHADAD